MQYRQQQKGRNLKTDNITSVTNTIKQNIILHYDRPLNSIWSMRSSVQGSAFKYAKQNNTYGFAIIQDIKADFRKVSFESRLAYYNTDNYDNRIYVYEQDVLYAFSFPAYNGKGIRHYLLMSYKPNKIFDLQIKWARTDLFNTETIGSSYDEIAKPHKSDIKIQLKLNW